MIAPRHRVYWYVALLVALSWGTIAFLRPNVRSGLWMTYIFGTTFGHGTLAAAWTVLGPGRLVWRLPLSLAWVVMLGVAIYINGSLGPDEAGLVVGGCVLVQWLSLQVLLWCLRLGFGCRLEPCAALPTAGLRWRFGTRQLMMITTIVGVVFGIGRVIVVHSASLNTERAIQLFFLFLAASAIVFSLPILIAVLLERRAAISVVAVLALAALGTLGEASLMQKVVTSGPGFGYVELLVLNGFTIGLVLAVAVTLRLCGYCLTGNPNPSDSAG